MNNGDNKAWTPQLLTKEGAIYSYVGDVLGDGDLDFFRYPGPEATFCELWLNQSKKQSVRGLWGGTRRGLDFLSRAGWGWEGEL